MKKIKIELYNFEILLFTSPQDLQRWMRKNCEAECTEYMVEFANTSEGSAGLLPKTDGTAEWFISLTSKDLTTLCHESLHIAYMALDAIGVKHDVENHESLCYLQHHIFEKAAKKLGMLPVAESH